VATGHSMIFPVGVYATVMIVIWTRGYRLKKRVAELVEATGQRIGLKRVDPRQKTISRDSDPNSEESVEQAEAQGETSVSPQS